MQVSVENNGKLERTLTVSFPGERFVTQVNERVAQMSRTVQLKGFRPGKVPRALIQKRFGHKVSSEVLSELIESTLRQALSQEKLEPVGTPAIDTTGTPENGRISYTARFEVKPDFPELDIASLNIERLDARVTDADVDAMIQTLRRRQCRFEQSVVPATVDDVITYEYSVVSGDYRFPAQGAQRGVHLPDHGSGLRELDEALPGHVAGDNGELDITFPGDFSDVNLAGKTAQVSFQVIEVKKPLLPELDAGFFRQFGVADGTMESFRREVRLNLERELKMKLLDRLKIEVAEKLSRAYEHVDVPHSMVQEEMKRLAERRAKRPHGNEVLPGLEAVARKRVLAGLLLAELQGRQAITLDRSRVTAQLEMLASTCQQPQEFIDSYRNDPDLMTELEDHVLEDQLAEWVAEHASTTVRNLGFAQVMQAQ